MCGLLDPATYRDGGSQSGAGNRSGSGNAAALLALGATPGMAGATQQRLGRQLAGSLAVFGSCVTCAVYYVIMKPALRECV